MRLNQPMYPPPGQLDPLYLRHALMRSSYLNRRDKRNATNALVAMRKVTKEKLARMAKRWGVSMQVVVTTAIELLDTTSEGVDLWPEDGTR